MKNVKTNLVALAALFAASAFAGQDPAPPAAPQNPPAAPQAAPKPQSLNLFVYPGAGQDAAKQAQDENECYAWARQQTGIDPTATPAPAAAAEKQRGGAVKGAARGAAAGAAVGAIADDDGAGEGAGIGATAGAVKGRRAQKKANKQAEAQAQQTAQTQDAQTKETFKKAWGACLEGRSYSVK
jgi:hypothetical protein